MRTWFVRIAFANGAEIEVAEMRWNDEKLPSILFSMKVVCAIRNGWVNHGRCVQNGRSVQEFELSIHEWRARGEVALDHHFTSKYEILYDTMKMTPVSRPDAL